MRTHTHEFFTRLVAARSVSSADANIDMSNAQASHAVAGMLDELGFTVTEHPVPTLPNNKINVSAHIGPDEPNAGLLLAGHTDTVPCDPASWATDPFQLTQRDGNLYGLGACDMKGFFAVIAEALADFDLSKLRAPLRVWATANEECGMEGAKQLAKVALPCKAALVGEPTGLRPVFGHKGALAEQLTCIGKSGHASVPASGHNAIDAISKVMAALHADLATQTVTDVAFVPPTPTLNFGHIHGGDAFNRICDRCRVWLDRRLMPGENVAAVRARLHEIAQATVAKLTDINIEFVQLVTGFNAVRTEPAVPLIKIAEELTGHTAGTVAYATEAPYYAAAGMDVLIMGAGDIAVAHQPNENVAIDDITRMADFTRKLVQRLCVDD